MSDLTEATARELISSMKELTFAIKGLTGVLLEDRDMEITVHGDTAVPEGEGAERIIKHYMDGTPIGGT